MGDSPDDKAYTYREFNSMGEFDDSKGTIDGDTWAWNEPEKDERRHAEGKIHDEDSFTTSDFRLRNIAGWYKVDAGDGRQGDGEVGQSERLAQLPACP